jgi:hypothetical protein
MSRPILAWHVFWNLWTKYFFNFPNFFSGHGQPWITETTDTESADKAVHLYYNYKRVDGATISSHSINTTTLHRSKITKSENTAKYVCQEVTL